MLKHNMNAMRPTSLPISCKLLAAKHVNASQSASVADHLKLVDAPTFSYQSEQTPNDANKEEHSWTPLRTSEIGRREPVWAPDAESRRCMLCHSPFTKDQCQYHCRACGRLLCGTCCTLRMRLPFASRLDSPFQSRFLGRFFISRKRLSGHRSILHPVVRSRYRRLYFSNRPSRVCTNCFIILSSRDFVKPEISAGEQLSICSSKSQLCYTSSHVNVSIPISDTKSIDMPSVDVQSPRFSLIAVAEEQMKSGVNSTFSLDLPDPLLLLPRSPLYWNSNNTCSNDAFIKGYTFVSEHRTALSLHDTPKPKPPPFLPDNRLSFGLNAEFPQPEKTGSTVVMKTALTPNLHVQVHATDLACCLRQPAWCFCSQGFPRSIPGQQEIVLLLLRQPDDQSLPPTWVFHLYHLIYLALLKLNQNWTGTDKGYQPSKIWTNRFQRKTFFGAYDCFFLSDWFRSEQVDHFTKALNNCLFFSPTHQCLEGLLLPHSPFLFMTLIDHREELWAKHLPLRLLLRLGRASRYYPTSLASDPFRDALYDSNNIGGLGIIGERLLAADSDRCRIIRCRGTIIRIHSLSNSSNASATEIMLPARSHAAIKHWFTKSDLTDFTLLGYLDPAADSHLVCIQVDRDSLVAPESKLLASNTSFLTTEAISIANTRRQRTGVTFAIISVTEGHMNQPLSLRLVEDGVVFNLRPGEFSLLTAALLNGEDFSCRTHSDGESDNPANSAVSLLVRWTTAHEDEPQCGEDLWQVSWVDAQKIPCHRTFLVPLDYQLVPWLKVTSAMTKSEPSMPCLPVSMRLAWARVHVLTTTVNYNTLPIGRLTDRLAELTVQGLLPYLAQLRAANHTQVALRVHLQPPDQFGYQLSAASPAFSQQTNTSKAAGTLDHLPDAFDSAVSPFVTECLAQMVTCRTNGKQESSGVVLELDFYILD